MGGFDFIGHFKDATCVLIGMKVHDQVPCELGRFLKSKDTAERFVARYLMYAEKICQSPQTATQGVEWLGCVKGSSGLWSLKFKNSNNLPNIRILLTISGTEVALWHAFVEQKTEDYQRAIKCAERRISEDGR